MLLIRKIGITIIIVVISIWLLNQLNILPKFLSWFKGKPLLIENTALVVEKIKDLQQIVTVASSGEVAVYEQTPAGGTLIGNVMQSNVNYGDLYTKKLGIIIKGYLHAGVDFSKLKKEDITVQNDSVAIKLPPAEILTAIVNPSDTEIFIEQGSWSLDDVNKAKQKGRDALINKATEKGIFSKANERATIVVSQLLKNFGFKKVAVIRSA
jgi:hypothetical protein